MKYFIGGLFIIFNLCSFAQERDQSIQLVMINDSLLKELINQSGKDYNLVVNYTGWCKPCVASLPKLIELSSKYANVETFFINPDPLKYDYLIKRYLAKHPEIKKGYVLDDSYKGVCKKRYLAFQHQIYPQYAGHIGLPSIYIMNKNFETVELIVGSDFSKLEDFLSTKGIAH
ncbi:MAG: hypothetical protein WCQ70_05005 [Lentimicrobiaceae bacterium]